MTHELTTRIVPDRKTAVGRSPQQLPNEAALADARLAAQDEQAAGPAARRGKQSARLAQFTRPADQRGGVDA
jgi:hypothetical protein